jgi:hypothetical protein
MDGYEHANAEARANFFTASWCKLVQVGASGFSPRNTPNNAKARERKENRAATGSVRSVENFMR